MIAVRPSGPADLRDQSWLDERIAAIEEGVQAVIEIAANWTGGRNLARLHPGVSAADYIKEKVGSLRLEKAEIRLLLSETELSNRQIAAVAGASEATVRRTATASDDAVQRPPTTLGADGKRRPARRPDTPAAEPVEETVGPSAETDDPDDLWVELDRFLSLVEPLLRSYRAMTAPPWVLLRQVPSSERKRTIQRLTAIAKTITYLGTELDRHHRESQTRGSERIPHPTIPTLYTTERMGDFTVWIGTASSRPSVNAETTALKRAVGRRTDVVCKIMYYVAPKQIGKAKVAIPAGWKLVAPIGSGMMTAFGHGLTVDEAKALIKWRIAEKAEAAS